MLPEKNCFSTALRAASAALGRFLHEMDDAFQDCVIEMACSYVFLTLCHSLELIGIGKEILLGVQSIRYVFFR